MVVATPDNDGRTRACRVTVQGVNTRPIWASAGRPDPYPWRFRIAGNLDEIGRALSS